MKEELTAHDQSAVRSKLPAEENLVHLRDTQIVASDTRERYRQKTARITLDSMVQFVGLLDAKAGLSGRHSGGR